MSRPLKIELSPEEESTLRMWVGSGKTQERLALRARVILLAAEGLSVKRISGEVALSWQNCMKWRKRFLESGLDGLYDHERSGAPRSISAEERNSLIALARSAPDEGHSRWSLGQLSEASGHSISTVRRILAETPLNPPKTASWRGRSIAPEFVEKRTAILGLYLSPLEQALVLGVDEKAEVEVLDGTAPLFPPAGPRPLTPKRNWRASLLAALSVHDGSVVVNGAAEGSGSNGSRNFLDFLKRVYRRYPGWELHVIVDDPAGPGQAVAAPWVRTKRRFRVHWTPPRASWLSHLEVWFKIFAREVPDEGLWTSKNELIDQIMSRVKACNDSWAKPFQWTYE